MSVSQDWTPGEGAWGAQLEAASSVFVEWVAKRFLEDASPALRGGEELEDGDEAA